VPWPYPHLFKTETTSNHCKNSGKAKAQEDKCWENTKQKAGRSFSVIVHGDVEDADGLRRALQDWLTWMGLVPAGARAVFDRYIGYYEPYATSHDALDRDEGIVEETKNAARTLMESVTELRRGRQLPGADLSTPRPK
jgi:hypothetical protein